MIFHLKRTLILKQNGNNALLVVNAGQVKSSVALVILKVNLGTVLQKNCNSDFIAKDTAKHQGCSLFIVCFTVDVDSAAYKQWNYFGIFVGSADSGEVNSIFAFICGCEAGLYWVLAFAWDDLFDGGEFALVAGLQKYLLFLFMGVHVLVPDILQ